MILGRRMKQRIVIETPNEQDTGVNEYGDEDETVAEYWTATECRAYVSPSGAGEVEEDRETQMRTFDVFVDPSTTVTGFDRVRLRPPGEVDDVELLCRILGEPMLYVSTTGRPSHKMFRCEVVI